MTRFCLLLLHVVAILLVVLQLTSAQQQDVQITQWKGTWISDYVQNNPKYYQASNIQCSSVRFIINTTSGSAVNVAVKKNSLATFENFDYKMLNVADSGSYALRGVLPSDQIYVIVNGARASWNLYSLNFECL